MQATNNLLRQNKPIPGYCGSPNAAVAQATQLALGFQSDGLQIADLQRIRWLR
jgi:hypothetical protein